MKRTSEHIHKALFRQIGLHARTFRLVFFHRIIFLIPCPLSLHLAVPVEDRRRAEPPHGPQWCILHITANNEKVQNNIHSCPLSWLHCWSYRAAAYPPFFLTIIPSSFSYLSHSYTFISSDQASHLKVTGLSASPLEELDWDQKKWSAQVKEEY
jgi:hypothetical protein